MPSTSLSVLRVLSVNFEAVRLGGPSKLNSWRAFHQEDFAFFSGDQPEVVFGGDGHGQDALAELVEVNLNFGGSFGFSLSLSLSSADSLDLSAAAFSPAPSLAPSASVFFRPFPRRSREPAARPLPS